MQLFRNIICTKLFLGRNIASGWFKPESLLVVCFLLYLPERCLSLRAVLYKNKAVYYWMKYSKSNLHPGFTCQSTDLSFGFGLGWGFLSLVEKVSKREMQCVVRTESRIGKGLWMCVWLTTYTLIWLKGDIEPGQIWGLLTLQSGGVWALSFSATSGLWISDVKHNAIHAVNRSFPMLIEEQFQFSDYRCRQYTSTYLYSVWFISVSVFQDSKVCICQ